MESKNNNTIHSSQGKPEITNQDKRISILNYSSVETSNHGLVKEVMKTFTFNIPSQKQNFTNIIQKNQSYYETSQELENLYNNDDNFTCFYSGFNTEQYFGSCNFTLKLTCMVPEINQVVGINLPSTLQSINKRYFYNKLKVNYNLIDAPTITCDLKDINIYHIDNYNLHGMSLSEYIETYTASPKRAQSLRLMHPQLHISQDMATLFNNDNKIFLSKDNFDYGIVLN